MSAQAETAYSEAEARAFEEGREAYLNGKDYFESPYMVKEGRNLYLIGAFSDGWLSAEREAKGEPCETF